MLAPLSVPVPIARVPAWIWLVHGCASCGFPSPAEDYAQQRIDLNTLLVSQPDATFFVRARGDSMRDKGIDDGDILMIDRSLEARHDDIVLAVVDGDFTIKTLFRKGGRTRLVPANPIYPDIEFKDGQQLEIWGVVKCSIKEHRRA